MISIIEWVENKNRVSFGVPGFFSPLSQCRHFLLRYQFSTGLWIRAFCQVFLPVTTPSSLGLEIITLLFVPTVPATLSTFIGQGQHCGMPFLKDSLGTTQSQQINSFFLFLFFFWNKQNLGQLRILLDLGFFS